MNDDNDMFDDNGSDDRESRRPPGTPMHGLLFWAVVVVCILLTLYFLHNQDSRKTLPASELRQALLEGRVHDVKIVSNNSTGSTLVQGDFQEHLNSTATSPFETKVRWTEDWSKLIETNVGNYKYDDAGTWAQMVMLLLPIFLILLVGWFLFARLSRNAGRGALQFGKSRARLVQSLEKVTFKDVAGIQEAKEEVEEIIDYLREPEKFHRLGGRIPKGVLMVGPPGTGKTLLARAIAGEADVPFFNISGSDFVEMFVGVGASRVRDMFEQGKRNAPCIIFIDEIDAVGRSRFSGIGGGHDEREQTLNALLVEMDGFESKSGVIVISATNRPDVLDPALLRPGRFDRQIAIDLPDMDGRLDILKVHSRKVKMSDAVDLHRCARGTAGFSGADLANLVNEAALLAARDGKNAVDMEDLEEARDKVRWGKERRSRVMDEHDRKVTAYHEAGHALVGLHCEHSTPLHKITIIPRGTSYLGATMQLPTQDKYTTSRTELMDELTMAMGGRCAEEIIFNEVTSGAAGDIRMVTRMARKMVCEWGMSAKVGLLDYEGTQDTVYRGPEMLRPKTYSEGTAREIDEEIRRLVNEAHDRARQLLEQHRDQLETLGAHLLEQETLDVREVKELLGMPPDEPDPNSDAERPRAAEAASTRADEDNVATDLDLEDGSANLQPGTA